MLKAESALEIEALLPSVLSEAYGQPPPRPTKSLGPAQKYLAQPLRPTYGLLSRLSQRVNLK